MQIYRQFGINSVGLRLFSVFGPGQNLANLKQGMVSIYIVMAFSNKHVKIKGSKDRFRDFVYIDDVVNAFVASESYAEHSSGLFNIGTGQKTTVEALISNIRELVPFDFTIEYSSGTLGDQHGVVAEIDEAKKQLGWQPSIELRGGLEEMIHWVHGQNLAEDKNE